MFQANNFETTDKRNSNEYLASSQQYQMPNPTSWNIHDLNWNFDGVHRPNQGSITHFTAFTNNSNTIPPAPSHISGKRKTLEPESSYRPTKQFISEQKMIEHLNSMHLSSTFTNHNISPDTFEDTYKVFLSPADLEEKLRNAQRITVCEQIKNLSKNDPLLPKALLDKVNGSTINPPYCSALVLWQPPSQILKVHGKTKDDDDEEEKEEKRQKSVETNVHQMESEELFMDNNNSSSIDFNSLAAMNDVDMDDL